MRFKVFKIKAPILPIAVPIGKIGNAEIGHFGLIAASHELIRGSLTCCVSCNTKKRVMAMKKTVLKEKVPFKKRITDILLKDKNEILKDVAARTKSESSDSKSEIGDIFDIATIERERELSLIFGDRDREKLAEIEDSLERIGNGTYGFCESCEEPIGEERLIVMPFTKVCIECKAKDEKMSGSRRKYAEGMGVISDKIDGEGEE